MKLDHQLCYSAIKSRDERFDGRFFTGVVTTGIYCRPICPAKTPHPENVRFFASAAAAAEAGFRPCLRCRPESSPGTPEWNGTSETVTRALRLIAEGFLDEFSVDDLAHRLNIGERQLRRLFVQHLGAPPIAVAQTRRVLFAKKLVDETTLPMSEVAMGAGFPSIRRFNDAIRQTYGKPPTELRKDGAVVDGGTASPTIHLKLSFRPPYDWHSIIRFLQARATPGVESVEENRYRRTVRLGETAGIIEVRPAIAERHLLLSVPVSLSKHLTQIVERVRRLFDLNAVPEEIAGHLRADDALTPIVQCHPGLRVPGAWDGFEIAVRAILGQQVSVKAATTFCGRVASAFGDPMTPNGEDELTHLFPAPERLAEADLSGLGAPQARIEAIRELARAVVDGRLVFGPATSLEEATDSLTALPGIGPWTAHYIAMRALREPDAFPAGDLILRRAAAGAGNDSLTAAQLLERAEAWRPWRAYAAMFLWMHYVDLQGERRILA